MLAESDTLRVACDSFRVSRSSLCVAQGRCCVARAFRLASVTRKAVSDSLIGFQEQEFLAVWDNLAHRGSARNSCSWNPARPRAFLLPGPEVDDTPGTEQGGWMCSSRPLATYRRCA